MTTKTKPTIEAGSSVQIESSPGRTDSPLSTERLTHAAIRDLIVPIEGYDDLKCKLLVGELERYRASLEWIQPRRHGSLLDMGSRGELVPVYLGKLGFTRTCCLDERNATRWQRLVHRDGPSFSFESYRIQLERTPFPFVDETFDQAVAMEVLEHLAVDPMFMVAEANRVLKLGGSLLITTPNITSLSCLYHLLWSRHPSLGRQTFGPGIMDRHHREYTPREVVDLVEAAGFTVEKIDTFDSVPPGRSIRHARTLLKMLNLIRPGIDLNYRNHVIRCACVKTGPVVERFPESLYPRYPYYDYAAYDRELTDRFGGRRYWRTEVAR